MTENHALIERAKQGDTSAFRQVLEQHYDMIYRVAYKFSGTPHDAQDIAQEVCLRLVDRLRQFRGESRFMTWLYRLTVNTFYDTQKKRRSHAALEQRYVEYDAGQQEDAADSGRKVAWLYRAIAALEPAYKDTALLVLSENLSHAEAGQILGCSEATVSWRMHEARKRLKTMAGRDE